MLPMVLLILALTAQQAESTADVEIPSCSVARCRGRRITHPTFGLFKFCVPHGMKFRRVTGFEGDIHDSITLHSRRDSGELTIFSTMNPSWGPVKSSPVWLRSASPTEGSERRWRCSEGDGRDFRLIHNGRSWRMLAFPMGFAEYQNVSADIARKFDRLLCSLCCEPLRP